MAAGRISAKNGKMTINAVDLFITYWDFSGEADLPDATDSESPANYKEHVIGRNSGSITVRGYVKTTALPDAQIEAGAALTNVLLFINSTLKRTVASATAKSLKLTQPIGDGSTVGFEGTIIPNGAWTAIA